MFTLYKLLEADPQADKQDLKAAFHKAAKLTHPDIHPGDDQATWRFRQVSRAYEILSDDELRAAYDHVLDFERRMEQVPRRSIVDGLLANIISGVVLAAIGATAVVGGYALSPYGGEARRAAADIVDRVAALPAVVTSASTRLIWSADGSQSDPMPASDLATPAGTTPSPGAVLAALREVTAEDARDSAAQSGGKDRKLQKKASGAAMPRDVAAADLAQADRLRKVSAYDAQRNGMRPGTVAAARRHRLHPIRQSGAVDPVRLTRVNPTTWPTGVYGNGG